MKKGCRCWDEECILLSLRGVPKLGSSSALNNKRNEGREESQSQISQPTTRRVRDYSRLRDVCPAAIQHNQKHRQ